jgi:hypothetical protein
MVTNKEFRGGNELRNSRPKSYITKYHQQPLSVFSNLGNKPSDPTNGKEFAVQLSVFRFVKDSEKRNYFNIKRVTQKSANFGWLLAGLHGMKCYMNRFNISLSRYVLTVIPGYSQR